MVKHTAEQTINAPEAEHQTHTCSCNSASLFARSSSESELGLLSLFSLSLLRSLSDDDEDDEDDEDEELGGAGGSSGILAKQNSKTS